MTATPPAIGNGKESGFFRWWPFIVYVAVQASWAAYSYGVQTAKLEGIERFVATAQSTYVSRTEELVIDTDQDRRLDAVEGRLERIELHR